MSREWKTLKSPRDGIQILGARENNLKNIDVFIPRNKITLITGLSGSGKSTLAFDTLYSEGQRRYMESLSVYARYFINKMKKPKVDSIYGLSPGIAINQKSISSNPRSTVGTLTEAYDFLRLLYAKAGEAFCPQHKEVLKSQTAEEIAGEIEKFPKTKPLFILSPIVRGKKGEFAKELDRALSFGFDQARIDGQWYDIGSPPKLEKRKSHYIDVLIDCITRQTVGKKRIETAVQRALDLSGSFVRVENSKGQAKNYSLDFSCPHCDYSLFELEPKLFSFNSPQGACPVCNGTGQMNSEEDPEYPKEHEEENGGNGLTKGFSARAGGKNREHEEGSEGDGISCPECQGSRLRKEALLVKIKNQSIDQLSSMSLNHLEKFILSLKFSGLKQKIAEKIKKPLLEQISFLRKLSLDYLSLNRTLFSLSGGEAQRVRLASQLSSPVIGAMYVLDEPSIGLHPYDHDCVLNAVKKIRDRGNTVIIVEHDEKSICSADKIVDLGPGAGDKGGFLIAEGTVSQIKKNKNSLTGSYLSKKKSITLYKSSYKGTEKTLSLKGLRGNNLKNIDIDIPLSCVVGVSGVSGSGKSSLVTDTIYPLLANALYKTQKPVGAYRQVNGLKHIERVIQINQKPIGRTPRSNPVTYIGAFQMIRLLFSQLSESRMRGYTPGFFSFNVPGGRCENCKGAGFVKLEMRFLPDAFTTCEVCCGKRYNPDILNVRYKTKNISDILNMSLNSAERFFKNHPYIHYRLKFLKDVGLGYIRLGQSALTLSGGEAQRVKLSKELSKKTNSRSFYILDEPTTGLHFQDVERLIQILRQLADQGHTVLVIEHHLDILKSCDYLIDLGPGGGPDGGYIVAQGQPQKLIKNPKSLTGQCLRPYWKGLKI